MDKFRGNVVLSAAAHVAFLFTLFAVVTRVPAMAPYRMPGISRGVHLLTYYSSGAVAPSQNKRPVLPIPKRMASKTPSPAAPVPTPAAAASQSEKGTGTAAVSGLGNGEITMALEKVFPPPDPDLSTIAPGHHGEVVLNAVIDEQGNITQLTLLRRITPAIDGAVIATVQNWSYKPATRNGTPVSSEQELHFYYERA